MTDEADGAYDWPHAVGAESKAELLAEIKRLSGLLERADWLIQYTRRHVPADCVFENEALAAYDKLKGE